MDGYFPKDRNLSHLLSSLTSSSSSHLMVLLSISNMLLSLSDLERICFSPLDTWILSSIHPRKSAVWTWGNVTFQPRWRTAFWIWICVFRDAVVLVVGSFHPEMENTSFSCNRALEEISLIKQEKKTKQWHQPWSWFYGWWICNFASGAQDDHFFQDCLEIKIFPEDSIV